MRPATALANADGQGPGERQQHDDHHACMLPSQPWHRSREPRAKGYRTGKAGDPRAVARARPVTPGRMAERGTSGLTAPVPHDPRPGYGLFGHQPIRMMDKLVQINPPPLHPSSCPRSGTPHFKIERGAGNVQARWWGEPNFNVQGGASIEDAAHVITDPGTGWSRTTPCWRCTRGIARVHA